jgi:hypothetical protein
MLRRPASVTDQPARSGELVAEGEALDREAEGRDLVELLAGGDLDGDGALSAPPRNQQPQLVRYPREDRVPGATPGTRNIP